MNYVVCVDDTDMPGTKGTGWLVQEMCEHLAIAHNAACYPISRHQLFVHEEVPYTSHNSAMCFEMELEEDIDPVIHWAASFLEKRAEKGADPGLCVARQDDRLEDEQLIAFGKCAKGAILTKTEAYALARKTGIHLSEHGGTGDGIIGAVAGVGLRLAGSDGRYRGWFHVGKKDESIGVDKLCSYPFIDCVCTRSGRKLPPGDTIQIGSDKLKTIRMNYQQVVMVTENKPSPNLPRYRTITHQEAKSF